MRKSLTLSLVLLAAALFIPLLRVHAQEATPDSAVSRQEFTVDFGDFETQAELTYPADGDGPFPTVILIHGSTPADMDFTVFSFDGKPVSTNFKDMAEFLPTQGYAVIRYNKHYVTAPGEVDTAKYAALTLQQLVEDAGAVLDAALDNPLVDAKHIFIYGWSEGSLVGSELAVERPDDIAGIIFQGAVALPYAETFAAQITDVTVPYLRTFAPDGIVTSDVLQAAFFGNGGLVAKSGIVYVMDMAALQKGQFAIDAALDTNQDDALSIDDEIIPAVGQLVNAALSPGGFLSAYGSDTLPTVTEQASKLTMPVLILQGANDANTPEIGAEVLHAALYEAGNRDLILKVYDGLGHSLGKADSVMDDRFRPIEQEPLDDLRLWLAAHTGV